MNDLASENPALKIFRFFAWRILAAIFIALFIATLWFAISPLLALASPIVIIIFFPELAGMSSRVRRHRAAMILSYLEQAVRLNLPLPGMLDAARQSEESTTADRLRRLTELLEKGASLETSLRLATPEVSTRVVSLVGAAERTGQLPRTLARVVDEMQDRPDEVQRNAFGRWYPLLMTLSLLGIASMMMVFVVPKMEWLFNDFGLQMPWSTRLLIGMSRGFAETEILGMPAALLVLLVAAIVVLGGMFEEIWTPARRRSNVVWLDSLAWWLPVWHNLALHQGLADACDTLAGALKAGEPLPRAIEEAAGVRMNDVLSDRLQLWQGGIERGLPADQAAREARLPPLFCGMIGGSRGDVPAQALEFLASYYHARFSRSRELLRAAVVPGMAIFFGAFVLFVAAGMFTPLLHMMDHLSDIALKVSK